MPSTYSPDLRIELIANGEQSGTWGATTNSNLGTIIEDAIAGLATVSVTSANQALTALNGAADQARCAAVSLSTTTTANFAVYVPPVPKLYVVRNTSIYVATVFCSTVLGNTTAAGTGIAIPAGASVLLRSDGTNVVEQLNRVVGNFGVGGNATITGNAIISGNASTTGTSTLGNAVILGGSPGTLGQVVVSQGAGTAPTWGNAFVAGMIMMWSGSIASIPSGWALCNGSSGTPDLRDRFIVGAGSSYNPGNTGGSADAIVVSHTHTATDSGHTHADAFYFPPGPVFTGNTYGVTFKTQTSQTLPNGHSNVPSSTSSGTANITVASSGSSGTNANLPPYYALAFIMKL